VLTYYHWLAALGVVFLVLERFFPRVPEQRLFRRSVLTDLFYVAFNSKYFGLLLGYVTVLWMARLDSVFALGWLAASPWWVQALLLFITVDFLKWCIHNLLHRVPLLWEFHKVHHSIVEMDWIGDWRFHWVEILVYNGLLYAPTAFLGVSGEIALAVGVFDTLIGHFAHANLRWRFAWLHYVFNTPQMHIWHHNHPDCGPINRNFALSLSIWDWMFGTAYVPGHDPARLGFDGVESYPPGLPAQ